MLLGLALCMSVSWLLMLAIVQVRCEGSAITHLLGTGALCRKRTRERQVLLSTTGYSW